MGIGSPLDDRVRAEGVNTPQGRKYHTRHIAVVLIVVAMSTVLVLVQRPYLARERAAEEAVAISEEFIEALGKWDHQAASSLVRGTADISITPARSPEDLEMGIRWMAATESISTTDGCTASTVTEDGVHRVLCYLTHENAWSRALKLEPDTRSALTLQVTSGQIVGVFLSFAPMSFPNDAVRSFEHWLSDNHPEHQEAMYLYAGLPALTPESIELWRRYTDEFVAEQSSQPGLRTGSTSSGYITALMGG